MTERAPLPPEIEDFLRDWRVEIASRQLHFQVEQRAFDKWFDTRERMDYWLTTLAGGVLAYAVQSYDAGVIQTARFLAPLSWLFLLGSVVCGIRSLTILSKTNLAWLLKSIGERTTEKRVASLEKQRVWKVFGLGMPAEMSPEEKEEIEKLEQEMEAIERAGFALGASAKGRGEEWLAGDQDRSRRYGFARSVLLVLGLAILAAARVANLPL